MENENLKLRQLEEERKSRPIEEDIFIESVKQSDEKKRSFEKAFIDENEPNEETNCSKKLKSEEAEDLTSTSVNNASDVISDDDEVKNNQQYDNVILEEVEEIMIEDDSEKTSEKVNGHNGNKMTNENKDFNGSNDQDDDIIECSSEDDVIEINDDESQSRQTFSSYSYQNGNTNTSTVDSSNLNGEGSNDAITLE